MSYFYIYKLCNYLLMENHKYISEINNIINKQKIAGGGELQEALEKKVTERAARVAEATARAAKATAHDARVTASAAKATVRAAKATTDRAARNPPSPRPPPQPSAIPPPPPPPSARPPSPPSVGPVPQKGMPTMQKSATPVISAPPPTSPTTATRTTPQPSSKQKNNELKNMFNSKINFENYINDINGYIHMLADCTTDKINEFIAKSEQETSKIVKEEAELTNQQIDDTNDLSAVRQEGKKIQAKLDTQQEEGKEDLITSEKKVTALEENVRDSKEARTKVEDELKNSRESAAQNGKEGDNTAALELQNKIDTLKREESEAIESLKIQQTEIEKKKKSMLQIQAEADQNLTTNNLKSLELESKIKKNEEKISTLKKTHEKMMLENKQELDDHERILTAKKTEIDNIEKTIIEKNETAKNALRENKENIESIRKQKETIEQEATVLKNKVNSLEQIINDNDTNKVDELNSFKSKLIEKGKENEKLKQVLKAKDNDIEKNNKQLEVLNELKQKIEEEKTKLDKEFIVLRTTNSEHSKLQEKFNDMERTNKKLQDTIDAKTQNEEKLQKDIAKLTKDVGANDKKAIEEKLREEFEEKNKQLINEVAQLKTAQWQLTQNNKFIDKYIYSGFSLKFPSKGNPKFIELSKDELNKNVKLCTNGNFVTNTENNKKNYDYLIENVGNKKFVLAGVNNYEFKYMENKIYEIKSNKRGDESLELELAITPQNITPEQFTTLLQATDMDKCIKLKFMDIAADGKILADPIIVFVKPLSQSNNPMFMRAQDGGGFWKSKKKIPEEIQYNNEKVIPMAQFKQIKESIDTIIIKVKEYEKKLVKEKKGNIKHKTKLSKIKELIKLSGKINKLYEGSSTEKFKSLFTKNKPKPSTGGALFGLGKKRATNPTLPGESGLQQVAPMNVLVEAAAKQDQGPRAKEYAENILDEKKRDKGSKSLTKEKCMKIKKYLENFNEILKSLQNDTGDESLEKLKTDTTNAVANSEKPKNSVKNSLIEKMMDVQNKFQGTPSDGKPNNSTEILTITTMIIYDILLVSIVIICIIIYILFVINIIKFLYQCFLEVGNSQHNNLATGRTLRYKLLGYVVYINNCNLPSLFSSFNSVDTPSGTFMRLSKVLEKYFTNERAQVDTDTFESIFGELSDKVAIPKTPQKIAEEKHDKWLTEEGKDASPEAQEQHKATLTKQEIQNDQERKNTQYEENKNYKEPKFNIFLCIRLVFICIKLFITFITIIVISIITFILLSVVSQMANMDAIEISIIKKQKLFFMLLQLLAVSIMHIIIKLIIYKTMFVKIYNKYLNTYLNIIAIDLTINSLKKLDNLQYIDSELAIRLKNSVDNNSYIEERLIQLMNLLGNDDSTNETIIKYITIYMLLKYLYSYEKNKSNYLLYYSYFINDGDYSFPSELNMEKNNITTFYSLIPNKHRKTPIDYFKYSDIKNILDIENAEKIRQGVNTYISQINTYIADANSYFDDDNFIVSLGWYILINIILGTIYIIIIVTIILNETEIMKGNFNLYEFTKFE